MKTVMKRPGWLFLVFFFFVSLQSVQAGELITDVSLSNAEPVNMKMDQMNTSAASYPTSWSLTEPGKVTLFICDVAGNIVRTLIDRQNRPAGSDSVVWDRLDNDGDPCPGGIYFPVIKLKSRTKGVERYNPTAEPWGLEVVKGDAVYDQNSGTIQFETTQKSFCRIHVGEKDGGPLYKTALQWKVLEPGLHEIPWDGMDETGLINVAEKETLKITVDAFSLPDNTILLPDQKNNDQPKKQKNYKQFPIPGPHGGKVTYFPLLPAGLAPDFKIGVGFNDGTPAADETHHLSGKTFLNVTLEQGAINQTPPHKETIEIYLFVDGQLIHEIPFDTLPAALPFDTTIHDNGEHIVTVNLRTSQDRSGTYSMIVNLINQG